MVSSLLPLQLLGVFSISGEFVHLTLTPLSPYPLSTSKTSSGINRPVILKDPELQRENVKMHACAMVNDTSTLCSHYV